MCGLTTAINISQKKYRVSLADLSNFRYRRASPKSLLYRDSTLRVHYEERLCLLFFLSSATQEHLKIRTSLAKILLNLIILSPCYLIAYKNCLFVIRVLFVVSSLVPRHDTFSIVPQTALKRSSAISYMLNRSACDAVVIHSFVVTVRECSK